MTDSDIVVYPVRFERALYASLEELSKNTGMTKASVLRVLVREASKIEVLPFISPDQISKALEVTNAAPNN